MQLYHACTWAHIFDTCKTFFRFLYLGVIFNVPESKYFLGVCLFWTLDYSLFTYVKRYQTLAYFKICGFSTVTTLTSRIVVAPQINVALGIFSRINKRSPSNNRSLGKTRDNLINVAPLLRKSVLARCYYHILRKCQSL